MVNDGRVQIARLTAPRSVSLHSAAAIEVGLRAFGDARAVRLQVFDGGVLVGRADADVPGSATDTQPFRQFAVPLEWAPVAAGPRRLRVVAQAPQGVEMVAEFGVEVSAEPLPALFYEPEATWLGTFVRRALAADPRFTLDARTRLAPGLTMTQGGRTGLAAASLADARAVVVAAPETLTTHDVDLLERFARIRGGSVVLLPDRSPTGPVLRLLPPMPGSVARGNRDKPGCCARRSSLTFDGSTDGITVLETAENRPVVVARAIGRGRIIVSGSMDAWRFRGDGKQFNAFFSGLVAAAIDAAGPALHLAMNDRLIGTGESATLHMEWRTMEPITAKVTARAELRCSDGYAAPIRLWPGARPGLFSGAVHAIGPAECTLAASMTGSAEVTNQAALLVADAPARPVGDLEALDAGIAAHGGAVVDLGDEPGLVSRVAERLPAQREPHDIRPMRSPWWMLPFAACLGAEWWLRRRRGER